MGRHRSHSSRTGERLNSLSEIHLRLLKAVEANPQASQRELSKAMGVSLGKTHYCLRALTELGWIKANRFRASADSLSYAYLLTPAGLKAKAQLTVSFLERKLQEFELLKREIATLRSDLYDRLRAGVDVENPEQGL